MEKVVTSAPAIADGRPASSDEVKRILGELDAEQLLDILALHPTLLDVEQASLWLAGDADVFGAGQPLPALAGEIVAILSVDDEEERPRAG
jgi:hypothetical protein